MSPVRALFRSRKFLLLLLDVVVNSTVYVVSKYAAPVLAEDILFFVGLQQPVWVALIGAIAYEDGQAKRAGTDFPQ